MNLNKVLLIGRLTRDVELRYLSSGTAVTDIGLAVNHRYRRNDGEFVEETCFVDITVWGKTAENCIECGECEPKCQQNIRIIEQLKEVAETLED